MTKCRSEKIRNLIITHLGNEELEKYDATVNACKLGNALKDERTWAPLCPEYKNLKGVTCEDIDEFLSDSQIRDRNKDIQSPELFYVDKNFNQSHLPEFFYSEKYLTESKKIAKECAKKIYLETETKDEEQSVDNEFRKKYIDYIINNTSEEEFSIFTTLSRVSDKDIDTYDIIDRLNNAITYEKERIHDKITLTKDYLHHVKVYDRDEEYAAFKDIGEQIEEDMPRVLHDPSTIFVTTPRGGHEMLSIFTYANDIDKSQIPSDIRFQHITSRAPISEVKYREDPISTAKYLEEIGYEPKEEIPTDVYGQTWLNNMSKHVKNIFIVDDIIASGNQIYKTSMVLEEMFPDANISSITLCKRDKTTLALPAEVKKYYTDTKTIGIKKFIELKGKTDLFYKEYITCLFPHCCPDGESDKLIIELMGSERCSPEKRIARQDL